MVVVAVVVAFDVVVVDGKAGRRPTTKPCDLLRVGSNDFEKKKIVQSHSSPPSTSHMA